MTDDASQLAIQKLPKLKFGFTLAAIMFISQMVWGAQRALHRYSQEAGGYAAAVSVFGVFFLAAYLLYCIAAYHRIANGVEGWRHPITPTRAVRFHFIPIYNIYWSYRWPRELAKFINWRTQRRRMSGALVGTVILVGTIVGTFFDGSVGGTIILCGFAYVSRCLRDALAAPSVPAESHVTSGLDAAALAAAALAAQD